MTSMRPYSPIPISNTGSDYRVLLIVPDNRYVSQSKESSFICLLKNDSDFNSENTPNLDMLEWKDKDIPSGSLETSDYTEIARQISAQYFNYDGFVVLDSIHTIPYTASYLSFMLENVAKPVVLTGAHSKVLNQVFSDAKPNLLHSLIVAGCTNICEVVVCFNRKIFRGNRIQRLNNCSYDPFATYNYPKLGTFVATGLNLSKFCMTDTVKKRFRAYTKVYQNIIVLHLIPQLTDNILKTVLCTQLPKRRAKKRLKGTNMSATEMASPDGANDSFSLDRSFSFSNLNPSKGIQRIKSVHGRSKSSDNENDFQGLNLSKSFPNTAAPNPSKPCHRKRQTKGVVISFFGVGNAPCRPSFKEVLKTALEEYDCEIVITCQSLMGGVDTTVYQSGNLLSDLNLITAADMTTECCVAKLSYLMAKGLRGKQLKEQFETNLRGEMTELHEKQRRVVHHIPMSHSKYSESSSQSESEEVIIFVDDDNGNDNNNKQEKTESKQ